MTLKIGGRSAQPMLRLQKSGLSVGLSTALDKLIALQPDPKPSRPEMIRRVLARRLAEEGLSVVELDKPHIGIAQQE